MIASLNLMDISFRAISVSLLPSPLTFHVMIAIDLSRCDNIPDKQTQQSPIKKVQLQTKQLGQQQRKTEKPGTLDQPKGLLVIRREPSVFRTWINRSGPLFEHQIRPISRHEPFRFPIGSCKWLVMVESDISHLQDQIGLLFFMLGFSAIFPLMKAIFSFHLPTRTNDATKRTIISFHYNHILDVWSETYIAKLPSHITVLYRILVSQGVGLAIGSLVMDLKAVIILCLVMIFLLIGGFFIQHAPSFISWIKYFSFTGYTFKIPLRSHFEPNEMYPYDGGDDEIGKFFKVEDFPSAKVVGLENQSVYIFAMGVMLVGYRHRDRKYPNGGRPNREATSGYWKATETDKPVLNSGGAQKAGVKKAPVGFLRQKAS
ncbi:hypothetical protein V6N12_050243 [Hibiscus sabdariffa]|uniref:NAC domain-containing protein n=1 Tax=Hibiscus sabdariffa TaxID=183260 RepID=A0ABR2GBV9_9ROSI